MSPKQERLEYCNVSGRHSGVLSLSNTVMRSASPSTRAEEGESAGPYHFPPVRLMHEYNQRAAWRGQAWQFRREISLKELSSAMLQASAIVRPG